jgi:DNA transformation protein
MFGGTGLFINGLMFGVIARDELYFKVGDSNRAAFQAAGEHPFSYDTKLGTHTITSYWHCPPALMDDAEIFRQWASNAIDAAGAAARAKPKKPRRRQPAVRS